VRLAGPGYPAACGVETCSSPGRRPLTSCAGTRLASVTGACPHSPCSRSLTAALETVYQDTVVEVTEFWLRRTLAHLSLACAEMLSARTARNVETCRCLRTPSGDSHRREIHGRRIAEAYYSRWLADRTAPQDRGLCASAPRRNHLDRDAG
jgi:hypothetical protein